MFRVHQFNKVEMFVFVEPDTSWDEHERLLDLEEQFFQALGLPYRVMNVAAGDLGASAAKKYDIEAWFPFQERYREVTSCSNTTDYQSRRLGIRYRAERRPREPAHAERDDGHGPCAPRDPRELPGRRARGADALRRAGRSPALVSVGHNARRRGAGAVERGGLENRWACKRLVGSNPTPAADENPTTEYTCVHLRAVSTDRATKYLQNTTFCVSAYHTARSMTSVASTRRRRPNHQPRSQNQA